MSTAPTLIIDIDSSSAGACVLDATTPRVSAVRRVPIGSGELRDAAALVPQLGEALNALLSEYRSINPKRVLVTLASPWFTGALRTLASQSERPVRVTRNAIRRVVAEHAHAGQGAGAHLEAIPIAVAVNGYRTRVLKTLEGTQLAITLYESAADTAARAAVERAVAAIAPHAALIIHSTPVVYAETLIALANAEYATVVDVGGEQTDIMVLSKGTLGFVGSIPEGSRSVARGVAAALAGAKGAGSLADSMSRLAMLASSELAEVETQNTSAALTNAGTAWRKRFTEFLASAGNAVPIPHRVIMVGAGDEMEWFARVVRATSDQPSVPVHVSEPEIAGPEFFAGALTFGDGGVFDSSLALAALFFHMRYAAAKTESPRAPVLYSVT